MAILAGFVYCIAFWLWLFGASAGLWQGAILIGSVCVCFVLMERPGDKGR